jgi:L-ascorbate metabolism protein UlaG (beta-lactamase superfamily)
MRLTWFGHSSVKLESDNQTIFIDPYAGPDNWYTPAGIVLVSRFHFDHCSVAKVRRCQHDGTHVLGTAEVVREVFPSGVLRAGESRMFDGVEVVGMPVANPHAEFRSHAHEKEDALGFVIIAEKKTIYYMSDSDFLPQTEHMNPDVLFIAVGGTYTAAPKEAAEIANRINPKLAIPIHWGGVVGTRDDAELFSELARVPVKILQPGESVIV